MWMMAGLLVVSAICAVVEVPSIRNDRKELLVFLGLLLLGTGLGAAMVVKADIPNPLDGIAAVYRPVGLWMQRMWK